MKQKVKQILKYVWWLLTDRGKYSYWAHSDKINIWEEFSLDVDWQREELPSKDSMSLKDYWRL